MSSVASSRHLEILLNTQNETYCPVTENVLIAFKNSSCEITEHCSADCTKSDVSLHVSSTVLIVLRVISVLILIFNLVVSYCLYTHKRTFSRKEFWMLLLFLNINDLICGVAFFIATFVNYDIISRNIHTCIFVMAFVMISQQSTLLNVLTICLYRLFFLLCVNKIQLIWRSKISYAQIVVIYMFCAIYWTIAFTVWSSPEPNITVCDANSVFGNGESKVYLFGVFGVFLPLLLVNVLYTVTFSILKYRLSIWAAVFRHRGKPRRDETRLLRMYTARLRPKSAAHPGTDVAACRSNLTANPAANSKSINACKISERTLQKDYCFIPPIGQATDGTKVSIHGCQTPDRQTTVSVESPEKNRRNHNYGRLQTSFIERQKLQNKADEPEICDKSIDKHSMECVFPYAYQHAGPRESLILIGLILGLINITTWPILIISTKDSISSDEESRDAIYLGLCIFSLNSLFNPCVYAIQSKEFRAALFENVKRLCGKQHRFE